MTIQRRDQVIMQIARAQGVIATMYGVIRDTQCGALLEKDDRGELGRVVSETVRGLDNLGDLWDERETNLWPEGLGKEQEDE